MADADSCGYAAVTTGSFSWLFSDSPEVTAVAGSIDDFAGIEGLLLGCWQVLPISLPKFEKFAGKLHRGRALVDRARARMIADGVVLDLQLRILKRLAANLNAAAIPFVLLKSAAMRFVAYPDCRLRRARDIDMGVAAENLEAAMRVLAETGFQEAQWIEDGQFFEMAEPELRASVESQHHELGFWVRLQEVRGTSREDLEAILAQRNERPAQWDLTDETIPAAYLVADIHHGLALEIGIEEVLATARTIVFEDVVLPVPSSAWLLFHLVYKIYIEGVFNYNEGAYQYTDLCRLIALVSEEDVAQFTSLVERFNLRAAAYYVLRRLPGHFGARLPTELSRLLDDWAQPDVALAPGLQNDWGDMWPKLWGGR